MLHAPPPLGLGTADVESLSGYLIRVARAHNTNPGQLLYRVLAWCEQGQLDRIGRWCDKPKKLRIGFNMNGYAHADAWLRATQRASARADLEQLTTRSWDHLFPPRGFLAPSLRWCPVCLKTDPVPYHRLAWMLQPVTGCVSHGCLLQTACVHCGKQAPVLHDRSTIAACPWCASPLSDKIVSAAPDSFELWCASEVGRLITSSTRWHHPPVWKPARSIRSTALAAGLATAAQIARVLQTSKVTVWYWINGRARPSLPLALQLFAKLGASLADSILETRAQPSGETQPVLFLRSRRRSGGRDWARIYDVMRKEISSAATRSLRAICREESVAVRAVRGKWPELCRRLVARRRSQQRDLRREHDRTLRKKIASAAVLLFGRGDEMSLKRLEDQLGKPGLFNSRSGRRALLSQISASPA